mgnify:CR=1 FL=1|tara:strand:+ start:1135 stop:1800 length:666 start_codon:yes stop_codon:yes gene_type:complete
MTFWNSISPPGNNTGGVHLKRDYRFHGYLSFIRPAPDALDFDPFRQPIRSLNDGTSVGFFLIHSFDKPSGGAQVIDYGMNPRNGIYDYGLKDFNFKEVNVEVYDTFDPDGATDSNPGRIFWEWLRSLGYDARKVAAGSSGFSENQAGRGSITKFISNLEEATANVLSIEIIDDEGIPVEKYNYLGPILSAFSFGKASYGTDNLPLITLTFQVAAVEYVSLN